jgi:hypothetical protein
MPFMLLPKVLNLHMTVTVIQTAPQFWCCFLFSLGLCFLSFMLVDWLLLCCWIWNIYKLHHLSFYSGCPYLYGWILDTVWRPFWDGIESRMCKQENSHCFSALFCTFYLVLFSLFLQQFNIMVSWHLARNYLLRLFVISQFRSRSTEIMLNSWFLWRYLLR